jgi:hypothetical protein
VKGAIYLIEFLQGNWLKHPLHPALVHIPTALWPAATVFDLLSRFSPENIFVQLAYYAILLGLVVALLAIPRALPIGPTSAAKSPPGNLAYII